MAPLSGLKVIDLTRVLAGPYCTMLMADMGAQVIKIEEPGSGDDARAFPPFVDGWSTYFVAVNRNKKSVALNLRVPEGKEVLGRLLMSADVLVQNFRPGSLDRLGLGYEEVHALHPGLIYCSISGYGTTGPNAHRSGYDPVIQAESGLMSITGFPDGEPTKIGVAVTDYLAGLFAFQGILLALTERQRTGRGQHVDIALLDSLFSTLGMPVAIHEATGAAPERLGNDHPSIAPYGAFRAKDGLIMICAGNQRLWVALCQAIEAAHLVQDPRFRTNADRVDHRPTLKRLLEEAFQELTIDELVARLDPAAVPCGRVRSIPEVMRDGQLHARGMVRDIELPQVGRFKVIGNPVKLSEILPAAPERPPALGEHTKEVLRSVGYTDAESERLTRSSVAVGS